MANFNCHIRIYVNTNAAGEILRSEEDYGHYDLQIDGINGAPLVFDGLTFYNPVFSYHPGSNTAKVLMASEENAVSSGHCRLYYCDFTASESAVWAFINAMQNTYLDLENGSYNASAGVATYNVKTGPFEYYDKETANCFRATAAWCSSLGNDILTDLLPTFDNHKDYLAWRMYDKYHSAWTLKDQY